MAAGLQGPLAGVMQRHVGSMTLINEFAGSGGDWMPWYFQRRGVGKLVGKRTWGGLVGVYGFPTLMDGGSVTAPNLAFWAHLKTPCGFAGRSRLLQCVG